MTLGTRWLHLVPGGTGQTNIPQLLERYSDTVDAPQEQLSADGDRMGTSENFQNAQERIEVRVLGPLRARRADGSVVPADQWRTAQTADLLRMLAMRVGEPMSVEVIIEALWPQVDDRHGRASVRTAASRLRKALGADCIQRSMGGLVLTGAWVDTAAFAGLAQQSRRHLVNGHLASAVTTAREAEALYLDALGPVTDTADWVAREREALAATFRAMIADAAEAAATLAWWHDARDLAEQTLVVEPCSERGFRTLMRAHRGLGETALGLKTFDRCRRTLADELGTDPSPETQALYRDLLADEPEEPATPAFSGRTHEVTWLREVAETASATGAAAVVLLVGPPGCGKTRVVDQAFTGAGQPLEVIACVPDQDPWPAVAQAADAALARAASLDVSAVEPLAVLVDDAHRLDDPTFELLLGRLATLPGGLCVVLAGRPALDDGRSQRALTALGTRAGTLRLPALAVEEVSELCAAVLGGPVTGQLTAAVRSRTDGRPGDVVWLVRSWASAGRIAATSAGLVLLDGAAAHAPGADDRHRVAQALHALAADELEVLQLAAAAARPVTPALLTSMLVAEADADAAPDAHRLRAVLDHLIDLGLLTCTDDGFVARDPLLADQVLAWARPSARRRLHRRVAQSAVSSAERVEQWGLAGETELSSAAAMYAVDDAVEEHDYERARLHLRQLCRAQDASDAAPADRLELLERWGDVALALGRTHESHAAFAAAASVARAHQLSDLTRLEAKCMASLAGSTSSPADPDPPPAVAAPRSHPAVAPARQGAPATAAPRVPGFYPGAPTHRDDLSVRLHRAVGQADEDGDPARRAAARAELVAEVCVPRRKFRAARRWTSEALDIAQDPLDAVRALSSSCLAAVALGETGTGEAALQRLQQLFETGDPDGPFDPDVAALDALLAHDLGLPDFAERYVTAATLGVLDDPRSHQWVAIRVATERNDLTAAQTADKEPTPDDASPLVRTLRGCASAALAMEEGDAARAHTLLLDVLDVADRTGVTLCVPEAVARLIVLEAQHDLASARQRFEHFEAIVGSDTWLPRENVLKLLARAAVRAADGRPDDAAATAAAAADTAEDAGLVLLASLAHRHRAVHLTEAGRSSEARLASATAARWRRSAFPARGPGRTTIDVRSATPRPVSLGLRRLTQRTSAGDWRLQAAPMLAAPPLW